MEILKTRIFWRFFIAAILAAAAIYWALNHFYIEYEVLLGPDPVELG